MELWNILRDHLNLISETLRTNGTSYRTTKISRTEGTSSRTSGISSKGLHAPFKTSHEPSGTATRMKHLLKPPTTPRSSLRLLKDLLVPLKDHESFSVPSQTSSRSIWTFPVTLGNPQRKPKNLLKDRWNEKELVQHPWNSCSNSTYHSTLSLM